jgi:hypothetical protein
MPEKSGIDAVSWLRSCVNDGEENRASAETVTMINVRVMEFSRLSADAAALPASHAAPSAASAAAAIVACAAVLTANDEGSPVRYR